MQAHTIPSKLPVSQLTVVRSLPPDGLLLPFPHGRCFVPTAQIVALHAERNYTCLHFCDGRTLLYSRTLGDLLALLPAKAFARIHRSHAINRQYIRTVMKSRIVLTDGSAWAVSRRRQDRL